jgi:general secretion pathway protein G
MTNLSVGSTKGFGLLDLMLTLIIASLLIALAIPVYGQYAERARVGKAIGDIGSISVRIESFRLRNNDQIPGSLNELVGTVPLDPWGNEYRFLNIGAAGSGNGGLRKDGKLNPLNTDFDLYSMGADEDSKGPLNATASRDDIVRANNGAFVGLGEDY